MDRAELCKLVRVEGEAAGPEGAAPQHRRAAQRRRHNPRVLVTARGESKVLYLIQVLFATDGRW